MARRITMTRQGRRPRPNRYDPNRPDWRAVHAPWARAMALTTMGRVHAALANKEIAT